MDPEELIEIGFTLNQATVYLELIRNPGQSGGQIAKKISIDRSFVYGILNSLMDKGFVTYNVKGRKRLFYPSDPENLLKDIEEKRIKAQKTITRLKQIKQEDKSEILVRTYEGKAGLRAYVREILKADSFCTFGGGGKLAILDVLKYDFPHYSKEFKKKKIKGKLITSKENKELLQKVFGNSDIEVKTLLKQKNDVNFIIFKNKLSIYSAEDKPYVIVIEGKKISNALQSYFDSLWERLE